MQLHELELSALEQRIHAAQADYEAFRARGLKRDMTRGKPSVEQLDLAAAMLGPLESHVTASGEDARNYGGLQGLPEVRALVSGMLGAPPEQIAVGENSSLALMHDCIAWAMLHGVPGSARPWSRDIVAAEAGSADAPIFLCPSPGYDRHFALCEGFGIRMIPVPLTGDGPDMNVVEDLVKDPAVKGMWCVPRYANPSGETYAPRTIQRLAAMQTAAPDFRLFWDNAYAVHHLVADPEPLVDILPACAEAGNPDRAFVFASTSKITLAGAGLSFFAGSERNLQWYLTCAGRRTIGPDKLNQLRHLQFLRDEAGLRHHMDGHRAILAPKFAAVDEALRKRFDDLTVAHWTRPEGGYFISLDARPGTARRIVALAGELGIALTPAGATWPYGSDPKDSNLRLAPSFPPLEEVRSASEGIALCILLATLEAERDSRVNR